MRRANEFVLCRQKYNSDEEFEKALLTCEKAMQKYPDNWELHLLAGNAYCCMDNYEKAIEYFEKSGALGTPFCDEKSPPKGDDGKY